MVKNPPANGGDADSVPDQGTKIPHAKGQLNPSAAMKTQCRKKKNKQTQKQNKNT